MLALWTAVSLAAQEPVRPNLEGLKYPVVARFNGIQGTVELVVKSDGIQLVSGHPLLVAAAKSNLEKWATPRASGTSLLVTYVFRLTDSAVENVEVDEPIGNKFDRFFLRFFHRPVTRRIKEYRCVYPEDYSPAVKSEVKDGRPSIEMNIEARYLCVITDVAAIAALPH